MVFILYKINNYTKNNLKILIKTTNSNLNSNYNKITIKINKSLVNIYKDFSLITQVVLIIKINFKNNLCNLNTKI